MKFKSEFPFSCSTAERKEMITGFPLPTGCSNLCPESCVCIMRGIGSFKHYKPKLEELIDYIAEGFNKNLMFYSTVQGLMKSRIQKKYTYEQFNYVTRELSKRGFTFTM